MLERVFQRKQVKRIALAVTPLASMTSTVNSSAMLPSALVNLPITPPLALASIEGEVEPRVAQASSPLNGGSDPSEEVLMEIENITTSIDEIFVVEAIIPLKRVLEGVTEDADLLMKIIGTTSPLTTNPLAGMIGTTSSPIKIGIEMVILHIPKEFLMKTILSSPAALSDSLPQSSTGTMLKEPSTDAAMQ